MIATYMHGLRVRVKGHWRFVGKLIRCGDKRVFFRRFGKKEIIHRNSYSMGFDVRVLPVLKTWQVEEVHHMVDGELFTISLVDAETFGVIDNNGEGEELYIDLGKWTVAPPPYYREPFGSKTIDIQTTQAHRPKPDKTPVYKGPAETLQLPF